MALLIAIAGVLASVAMVVLDRRPAGASPVASPATSPIEPGWALGSSAEPRRHAAVGAAVLVAASFLVVSPAWGVVALVPAAVLLLVRRSRPAALAAAVLTGSLGLVVAWRQRSERFFPDAGWPAHFADLHHAGLFVVALLLAGTWFAEPLPTGRDDAASDEVPRPADESLQPSAAPTTDPAR